MFSTWVSEENNEGDLANKPCFPYIILDKGFCCTIQNDQFRIYYIYLLVNVRLAVLLSLFLAISSIVLVMNFLLGNIAVGCSLLTSMIVYGSSLFTSYNVCKMQVNKGGEQKKKEED